MLIRIVADIRYITLYECTICGATQRGDTVSTTFDGHSVEQLTAFMNGQQQRSHDMPVGWSYNGKFKCPCCATTGGGAASPRGI